MTGDAADRARLLSLLREQAVMRGEFVLSSGQRSSYYLDARLVTLSAEGALLVGRLLFAAIAPERVAAVAGLTLGADPIVASVAVTSALAGRPVDALIVRKAAKEHGRGRRIEGPWRAGMRVAVLDDTLTTGASSLDAARALEEESGEVVGIWALIDREQGAREAIEAAGYRFTALFTAGELLKA